MANIFLPSAEGWLYLAILKDLCTKKIVRYTCSNRIDTNLTLAALSMAISREKPEPGFIHHTDRGVQYASHDYRKELAKLKIRQSMSRKGDPYDNAVSENFFSCLKCELIHHKHFNTREEAKLAIFTYIEIFYNTMRPYSGLGWLSPKQFHQALLRIIA